jgi:hypothetical protein
MAEKLQFVIEVKDDGSAKIKEFGQVVDKMGQGAVAASGQLGRLATALGPVGVAIAVVTGGVILAIAAFEKLMKAAEPGSKLIQLEQAFYAVAEASGVMANELIANLKRVTQSTVDDSDLMKHAMNLMVEGLSTDQIEKMASAATVFSKRMGTSVGEAFEEISRSVENLQVRGLRQVGITMKDVADAYEKTATSLGVYASALTEAEKRQAMVNLISEKAIQLQGQMGTEMSASAKAMQQLKASWQDFTEFVSKVFLAVLLSVVWAVNQVERVFWIMVRGVWQAISFLASQAAYAADVVSDSAATKLREFAQAADAAAGQADNIVKRQEEDVKLYAEGWKEVMKNIIGTTDATEKAGAATEKLTTKIQVELGAEVDYRDITMEQQVELSKLMMQKEQIYQNSLGLNQTEEGILELYKMQVKAIEEEGRAKREALEITIGKKQVAEAQRDASLLDMGIQRSRQLQKEWLDGWAVDAGVMEQALKDLGVTSTRSLTTMANDAIINMEVVKAQFEAGKTSATNYVNALKAATTAMQKLTGVDTSKERVKVEEDYQKQVRSLQEKYPDRGQDYQRELNSLIDETIAKQKQLSETPLKTAADISPALEEFRKVKQEYDSIVGSIEGDKISPEADTGTIKIQMDGIETSYNELKNRIESNPIIVKIQKESAITGPETGITVINEETAASVPSEIPAYAAGGYVEKPTLALVGEAGPEIIIPLNKVLNGQVGAKAITEIIKQFGGLAGADLLGSLGEIEGLKNEIRKKGNQFDMVAPIPGQMSMLSSMAGGSGEVGQYFMQTWQSAMENLGSELKQLQYQLYSRALGVVGEYGGIIKSFEQGGYVPRTGIYKLHAGEQVTPRGVNMGDVNININGSADAKTISKEIVKVLKYNLNSELRGMM